MRSIPACALFVALALTACEGNVDGGSPSGAAPSHPATCNGTTTTRWTSPDATRAVVADKDAVYFTTWGTPWPDGVGAIVRAPLAGGPSKVLSNAEQIPYAIAQDESTLYWTDYEAGTVRSIPKQGGTPSTLAAGLDNPMALTLRDGVVFFTARGAVDRVPDEGGTVDEVTHTGGAVTAVVTDGTLLFFDVGVIEGQDPSAAALWRVAPDGSDPVELARGAEFDTTEGTWSLTEHGDFLYWASTRDGAVYRVDKQTGSESVIAREPSPFSVAVSGSELYWSTGRNAGDEAFRGIFRAPLAGGAAEQVLTSARAVPYVIAVTPPVIAATTGAGNGYDGGELLRIQYCP